MILGTDDAFLSEKGLPLQIKRDPVFAEAW